MCDKAVSNDILMLKDYLDSYKTQAVLQNQQNLFSLQWW